jgi:antitoxin (DNA-binding transcriptional repressor) of toxin-antitoxin stability system
MPTLMLSDVQTRLPEILRSMTPGQEIAIADGAMTAWKVVAVDTAEPRPTAVFGSCRGMLSIINDDDSYADDFGDEAR